MVKDDLYRAEIELLRPGTIIPSPSTISRDIQDIYTAGSLAVKGYFSVCQMPLPGY
jgi:hypothetical protein